MSSSSRTEVKWRYRFHPRPLIINHVEDQIDSSAAPVLFSPVQNLGLFASVAEDNVSGHTVVTDKQTTQLDGLNDRLHNYIVKVAALEAHNKELEDELRRLKEAWGENTKRVQEKYDAEMDQLRQALEDVENEKANLAVELHRLREQEQVYRDRDDEKSRIIADQKLRLQDLEEKINMLTLKNNILKSENDTYKKDLEDLTKKLESTEGTLNNLMSQHILAENARQNLEETLAFIKDIHQQEMEEMALLKHHRGEDGIYERLKIEMENSMREIKKWYRQELDRIRAQADVLGKIEMQGLHKQLNQYQLRLQYIDKQNDELKRTLKDLRGRFAEIEEDNLDKRKVIQDKEASITDLQVSLDKTTKEMDSVNRSLQRLANCEYSQREIERYRELLEGEENRLALRQIIMGFIPNALPPTTQIEQASEYRLTIKTGDDPNAGTSAKVYITIYGDKATSEEHYIRKSKGPFEKGATDKMNIRDQDLGKLVRVRVRHDNSGSFPGWYLEYIEIIDPQNNVYFFNCDRWLAIDEDDKRIERILTRGDRRQMVKRETFSQVKSVPTPPAKSVNITEVESGEMSAKISYQRSAKGPVAISQCHVEGKYVEVENTGKRNEHKLADWKIVREIDGQDPVSFVLPKDFTLNPNGKIKIWAKGQRPSGSPTVDIECPHPNWGIGANIVTNLLNAAGEVRANHTQTTTFAAPKKTVTKHVSSI